MSNGKYAFMKIALEGFSGTGKTYTAGQIAIGLYKAIGSTKPIKYLDTEMGHRFIVPLFNKAGIPCDPAKDVVFGNTLSSLIGLMKECEKGESDLLIIDSLSHIWENYLEAYKAKVGRQQFNFKDWSVIKPGWKNEFSMRVLNGHYNILCCGRAGYEYETIRNEDTGKIEDIVRSGIKMRAEGETAYEFDILLLMERFQDTLKKDKNIYRTATVLKDRANLIDGKVFKDPTFNDFLPVWNFLSGQDISSARTDGTSDHDLIQIQEDNSEAGRKKKAVLEELEGDLQSLGLSTGAKDKVIKIQIMDEVFLTHSWENVKAMGLDQLIEARDRLAENGLAKQCRARVKTAIETIE